MEKEYIKKIDLKIEQTAYQPVKKCPFCQSVFLNQNWCESCGRNLSFDLIGKPYSEKSFFTLKEDYIKTFYLFYRLYPDFENIYSEESRSYQKKLFKRFKNLIDGFEEPKAMTLEDRPHFYFEAKNVIKELVYYHFPKEEIVEYLCKHPENLINQELLSYTIASNFDIHQSIYHKVFKQKLIWKFTAEDLIAASLVLSSLVYGALKLKLLFR